MAEPPPPGEPGYDPDSWFQHIVYVGLKIARSTGLGLSLFNGLRSRFVGVTQSILGAAATIIGQGVRAAAAWMAADAGYTIPLDQVPIAPKGFFGPEEVDRVVLLAERQGERSDTGGEAYDAQRLNVPEDWSKAAVEEASELQLEDDLRNSPELGKLVEWREGLSVAWIGKKY